MLDTIPVELTPKLVRELDALTEEGWYGDRSEAVRDAVRGLIERKRLHRTERAIDDDEAYPKRLPKSFFTIGTFTKCAKPARDI